MNTMGLRRPVKSAHHRNGQIGQRVVAESPELDGRKHPARGRKLGGKTLALVQSLVVNLAISATLM
jgi:hypothetical protein